MSSFSVTWDYLCPFARNAHEHLVVALEAGAPWETTFSPFSLMQAHVPEDGPPVWEQPEAKGVLALQAGIVVRDRFPDRFLATHQALFAARHDEGRDLGETDVVRGVLDGAGVPADEVFAQIAEGWPLKELRTSHEALVTDHQVFGVPTFVIEDRAVFVRLMTRPEGDGALARSTIESVLELIVGRPEINEFKYTSIPR
jgi:protein-disulfide isomerase-like protein with CxxC motif